MDRPRRQAALIWVLALVATLLLHHTAAQREAVTVSTGQGLQREIGKGTQDIVLSTHIDARQLIGESVFLVKDGVRSIKGDCTGPPPAALTDALNDVPLIPLKPRQCLILADDLLFEFQSQGGGQFAMDSLYLRMQRFEQQMDSGQELMAYNGAAVWMTNMTIQGDGPDGSALALKPFFNAQVFVSGSTIQDWNGTVGPVALIEKNSSLVLDTCVIKGNTNTENGTAIYARNVAGRTKSTVVVQKCELSGNAVPFFGRANADSALFYSDVQLSIWDLSDEESVNAELLPLREGFSTAVLAAEDNPLLNIVEDTTPAQEPVSVASEPVPGNSTFPSSDTTRPEVDAVAPVLAPDNDDDNDDDVSVGLIAGIVVPVILVAVLAMVLIYYFYKKKSIPIPDPGPIPDIEEDPKVNKGSATALSGEPNATATGSALATAASGGMSAHTEGGASDSKASHSSAPGGTPPGGTPPDGALLGGMPPAGMTPAGLPPGPMQQWGPGQMYMYPPGVYPPGYAPGNYGYQGGYGAGPAFYGGPMQYGSHMGSRYGSGKSWQSATPSALGPDPENPTITRNTNTWGSYQKAVEGSTSPMEELETALDAMCDNKAPFFGRYMMLSSVERRVGGQGVVQFATIMNASESAAIKFYLQRGAFDSEKELYMETQLKTMMPATLAIEENAAGEHCTPYGYVFPPFVIIERGQSLDEWARDNKPDFITIFQALSHSVRALRKLHSIGYAHRDIKPGNILRRPKQHDWTLIDFGCTAQIGATASLTFSLKYAPPEVIQAYESGCKTIHVDAAVDMWAIGVIAFELLTGERAFPSEGMTPAEADQAALDGISGRVLLPWEAGAPGAEERQEKMRGLRRTVLRCLERDPARRPGAEQLLRSWDHTFDNMQTRGTDWSAGSGPN